MFYFPPTTPGTLLVSSVSLRAALVCSCVREKEKKKLCPSYTYTITVLLNVKHQTYKLHTYKTRAANQSLQK